MYIHWSYAPACMQSSITSTYSGYITITCRPSRNDSDAPRAGKEGREPMACLSSPSKNQGLMTCSNWSSLGQSTAFAFYSIAL